MPLRTHTTVLLLLGLAAWSLSACTDEIAPPVPLVMAGTRSASLPHIALTPSGEKHLLWQQDYSYAVGEMVAGLVYWRTWGGAATAIYEYHEPGYNYLRAHLAVTDDGTAYLVWVRQAIAGGVSYNCYDVIPPTGAHTPTCNWLDGAWLESTGYPQVVARGSMAYAVFGRLTEVDGSIYHDLFFRQLAGGISSGVVQLAKSPDTYYPSPPELAIDSSGNLHVAWFAAEPVNEVWYNSNATMSDLGYMDQALRVRSGVELNEWPELAIVGSGAAERMYVATRQWEPAPASEQILYTSCVITGCTDVITGTVPLAAAQAPWRMGTYRAAGTGTNHLIAFTATLSGSTNSQVFVYGSGGGGTVTQLTTSAYDKTDLHLAVTNSMPVVSWRRWLSQLCPYNDTYVYDPFNGVRLLYASNCEGGESDLAGAGEWAAGVWLGPDPAMPEFRAVPWLSYNAYLNHLPVVMRP